ncbi:MAG: hypothetical protein ACE366_23665 [Bradymonadia bacterium]
MDATTFWFLILLAVAFGLIFFVRPPAPAPEEQHPPSIPKRVTQLLSTLTGDDEADAQALKQLLALGPAIVPLLLEHLLGHLRGSSTLSPEVQGQLERLIADFGLAASGPLFEHLVHSKATTRSGPALLRLLDRLGPRGAQMCLEKACTDPRLLWTTTRMRLRTPQRPDPEALALSALLNVPPAHRHRAFEMCAAWAADYPDLLPRLLTRWLETGDAHGAMLLLSWLQSWAPLITAPVCHAAAVADRPELRQGALRLAALRPDLALDGLVFTALSDPEVEVRRAAARLLPVLSTALPSDRRQRALDDDDPDVAHGVVLGAWAHGLRIQSPPRALVEDPRWPLLAPDTEDVVGRALAALADDVGQRETAIWALALGGPEDPRAQERLLLMARKGPDRSQALAALSLTSAEVPPQAVVEALRASTTPDFWLIWSCGAHSCGPALARALKDGPLEGLLPLLRGGDLDGTFSSLMRALEACQGAEDALAVCTTLYLGGPKMRQALLDALAQSGRGLIAAALQYWAAFVGPEAFERLATLHRHHPPLQHVALNLLEGAGASAIDPLAAAVAAGGDEVMVAALEKRLHVLQSSLGEDVC